MRLLLIYFVSIFCLNTLYGQRLEVGRNEKGNVVIYYGSVTQGAAIEILRSDSKGRTKVFSLQPASSIGQMQEAVRKMPGIYEQLIRLNDEALTRTLDTLKLVRSTEEIPLYNVPQVAFACGLAFFDENAEAAASYALVSGNAQQFRASSNEVWQGFRARSLKQAATSGTDLRLGWLVPAQAEPQLLGVAVYRSKPFTDAFEPIQTLRGFLQQGDSLVATVRDTTTSIQGLWHYAIRMIDRYGNPSAMSEIVSAHNFPAESAPTFISLRAQGNTGRPEIVLSWELLNAYRARTLKLYRSRSYDAGYEMIAVLPPDAREFVDPVTEFMEAYFYYFEVEDMALENGIRSAIMPGVCEYKPEALPVNEVRCEPNGANVSIHWQGNPPFDRGYYIMRTEGYDEKLCQPVSGFIPAVRDRSDYSWTDTDSLLRGDRHYTYSVIAESHGYLKSGIVAVDHVRPERPCYVPTPSSCKISENDDKSVTLITWTHIAEPDYLNHFGYLIYTRKWNSTEAFELLRENPVLLDTNWIQLSELDPSREYAVRALDIFGNKSELSPPCRLNATFMEDFGPRYLRWEPFDAGKGSLRWNVPSDPRCVRYELFVTDGESAPAAVAKLERAETSVAIERPAASPAHYYFIVAFDQHGNPSSPSEWVMVR